MGLSPSPQPFAGRLKQTRERLSFRGSSPGAGVCRAGRFALDRLVVPLLVRALRLRVRPARRRNRSRRWAGPANGARLGRDRCQSVCRRCTTPPCPLRLEFAAARQGSVAPLGSKCAKFRRAPPAHELAGGFLTVGRGVPRTGRVAIAGGNSLPARPCLPAPWIACQLPSCPAASLADSALRIIAESTAISSAELGHTPTAGCTEGLFTYAALASRPRPCGQMREPGPTIRRGEKLHRCVAPTQACITRRYGRVP